MATCSRFASASAAPGAGRDFRVRVPLVTFDFADVSLCRSAAVLLSVCAFGIVVVVVVVVVAEPFLTLSSATESRVLLRCK